jgi:multiple sugar transport system permease protein
MGTQTSQQHDGSFLRRIRVRIRRDRQLRERLRRGVSIIALALVLVWLLLPIFWAIETSLKTRGVAQAYPPVFYGFEIQWDNYIQVLTNTQLPKFIFNGALAATVSTLICLVLGVPHAYAIAHYRDRFQQLSFLSILAVRIIPPITVAVPFFIIYNRLGLVNTKIGVIIILTFLFEPFVVWIMQGFFENLPASLVDSARVDGCTKFQAFYKIILPLAKPGLGSTIIITWLLAWNEFTLVFILTTSAQAQTLPVGILGFVRDLFVPWNLIAAAAVIGMIPSIIVVVAFQQYLIKGLVERRI